VLSVINRSQSRLYRVLSLDHKPSNNMLTSHQAMLTNHFISYFIYFEKEYLKFVDKLYPLLGCKRSSKLTVNRTTAPLGTTTAGRRALQTLILGSRLVEFTLGQGRSLVTDSQFTGVKVGCVIRVH